MPSSPRSPRSVPLLAFELFCLCLSTLCSLPLSASPRCDALTQVSHLIPKHLPLVVKFRFASPPKVTLQDGKAILNVTVSIEVLIRHKNATLQPLFTVDGVSAERVRWHSLLHWVSRVQTELLLGCFSYPKSDTTDGRLS